MLIRFDPIGGEQLPHQPGNYPGSDSRLQGRHSAL
jgi:hypothetical protein